MLKVKNTIKSLKKSSLSEKLILYFLALGLGAILIISVFSFYSTKKALMSRTFDQLTSLRIVKKHQVELFFHDRIKDISLLVQSEDTRKITGQLNQLSSKRSEMPDWTKTISGEEIYNYLGKYRSLNSYFTGICIIASNGYGIRGSLTKDEFVKGPADSIFPASSYASLVAGPGGKNAVVKDIALNDRNGNLEMYIAAPVTGYPPAGNNLTGMVVLEVSIDAINEIMLNNNPESGLGQTGETYLVGDDYLMRSTSRFQPSSILSTIVKTKSVLEAYSGRDGSVITNDYRNIPVLSSFSKLDIPGLNWVILAEIDLKEATVPIFKMRNNMLFLSTLITIIFFGFVFIISKRITRPLIELKDAAIRVGEGNYDIHLPIKTSDEIGALADSFNAMAGQIQEKTNELQLERIGRLRSVFDGEEIERQRLSRELHDGIGQYLIALKLRIEGLLYTDGPRMKKSIQEVKELFDKTIDEIRRISNNLMPAVLEAFGIKIAIRNLCTETSEHTGIEFSFESSGELDQMHTNIKTYIFRIAQEAINNIVKHSSATRVVIRLSLDRDHVILEITDNGKGFDEETASRGMGNGIHNMRERVDLLHGTIRINSVIEKGTDINVRIPVF
jgi:signal transduction histidine kinase